MPAEASLLYYTSYKSIKCPKSYFFGGPTFVAYYIEKHIPDYDDVSDAICMLELWVCSPFTSPLMEFILLVFLNISCLSFSIIKWSMCIISTCFWVFVQLLVRNLDLFNRGSGVQVLSNGHMEAIHNIIWDEITAHYQFIFLNSCFWCNSIIKPLLATNIKALPSPYMIITTALAEYQL